MPLCLILKAFNLIKKLVCLLTGHVLAKYMPKRKLKFLIIFKICIQKTKALAKSLSCQR
jgi:hypothetical protein